MARIGIDIDDVWYGWYDRAHQICVEAGITNGVTPTTWQPYDEYQCPKDAWIKALELAGPSVYDQPPLPGTVDQLRRLVNAGHHLVFVTARGSFGGNGGDIMDWTRAWVQQHLDGLPFELHFNRDKTVAATDYFIDDNVDNVVSLLDAGVDAWLRTRPWNEAADLPRVDDLAQFVDFVLITEALKATAADEVRTVSSTGGEKGVKLARFDLIPARPMWQVAELFGKGSLKYAARNWERGYEWSKSYGALCRHLNLFWQGEDYDMHKPDCAPDCVEHTESHHLAAAAFHALALLEFEQTHPEFDDRPVMSRGPERSPASDSAA